MDQYDCWACSPAWDPVGEGWGITPESATASFSYFLQSTVTAAELAANAEIQTALAAAVATAATAAIADMTFVPAAVTIVDVRFATRMDQPVRELMTGKDPEKPLITIREDVDPAKARKLLHQDR